VTEVGRRIGEPETEKTIIGLSLFKEFAIINFIT
jgi:hypothetical protein